jgi:alpha-1,6-mannosyltransferase
VGVARASDRRDDLAYAAVAGVLVLVMVAHTLNRYWSADYWVHDATVDALRADVLDPAHALIGGDTPTDRYSPYTIALALGGRTLGLSTVVVLQIAAIANLALFLVAFRMFVVELTGRRKAALFALLATLLLWGIDPWRWSGFLNLNSIGFALPYPSMFATGLAFFTGWALLRYGRTGALGWLVLLGLGFVVVALSHPFTGAWTSVMLLALAVHCGLHRRERVVPLLVTAACAAVLCLAWPYFSLLDLAFASDRYSDVHDALYERAVIRLSAALPGFVIVARRFRDDHTDPLALMLLGAVGVYAAGALTGDANLGRVLPLVVLPAHIGIGVLVADWVDRRTSPTGPMVAWLALSTVVGVIGVTPGLIRVVPRPLFPTSVARDIDFQPITGPYGALEGALPRGTVVVPENGSLAQVAPAYGLPVVTPSYSTVFIDDVDARIRAAETILDPDSTPAERSRAIAEYDVGAVLCATRTCERLFPDGKPVAFGPSWTLIALPHDDANATSR